jgi:hypothetical protein
MITFTPSILKTIRLARSREVGLATPITGMICHRMTKTCGGLRNVSVGECPEDARSLRSGSLVKKNLISNGGKEMKNFLVLHKIDPDFWNEPDAAPHNDYEYVATVITNSMDEVFRITNTIDKEWWLNPEVEHTPDKDGFRSTSVGDIIVEMPENISHIVCKIGFKTIVLN